MKQPLPQRKGFGAGMNMLAPDYALPDGAVRNATNLDVTTEGVLRTRQGYASTPRVSGTRCHSLFANSAFMLHADGAALKRTTASGTETVASVQNAEPISYAQLLVGILHGLTVVLLDKSARPVRLMALLLFHPVRLY